MLVHLKYTIQILRVLSLLTQYTTFFSKKSENILILLKQCKHVHSLLKSGVDCVVDMRFVGYIQCCNIQDGSLLVVLPTLLLKQQICCFHIDVHVFCFIPNFYYLFSVQRHLLQYAKIFCLLKIKYILLLTIEFQIFSSVIILLIINKSFVGCIICKLQLKKQIYYFHVLQ